LFLSARLSNSVAVSEGEAALLLILLEVVLATADEEKLSTGVTVTLRVGAEESTMDR
jgi:hypothetical protein